MTLEGTVQSASPGLLGFDANTVMSATTARKFYTDGFKFCLRYVSRGEEPSTDLSAQEANDILSAGLALMPVQHVRAGAWVPTAALGSQDGTAAGRNAEAVGFPRGTNVWCDLEQVKDGTPSTNVTGYCEAWFAAARQAGYLPGLGGERIV